MSSIKVGHATQNVTARIQIPGSKSESNRLLILQALCGNTFEIENLSTAHDTQNLISILKSNDQTVDVEDAGTSMRFLTAYYCVINQHKIITGSPRMCQRPIHPLVNALLDLGFDVRYLKEEGFPPLQIYPTDLSKLENSVTIQGNISSQYITALLLIAPFLSAGLSLHFSTELTSVPYIEMTLKILKQFNVNYTWQGNSILISKSEIITPKTISIGGDWSSASYWYAIVFLANQADVFLEGLKDDWSQGDREIADWMKRFGVLTNFTNQGAHLSKIPVSYPQMMKMNFKDNPDLAQTFAVMFAAKNIYCTFSGLDSLKIKETDRIEALQSELKKLNVSFNYAEMYDFYQLKGEFIFPKESIKTYNDHRMALSFAALATLGQISIENPEVVKKSYPSFWRDLSLAGFLIE